MNFPSFFAACVIVAFCGVNDLAFTQNQKSQSGQEKKAELDLATVRGKIVNPKKGSLKFTIQELKLRMTEQVNLAPFPFPQDWQSRSPESRQQWMKNFQASDAGKQLLAKRQKQLDARKQFDVDIEDDGVFVVFDVAPGRYGLFGRLDREIDGKKYAFEVFGQIDVGKVNEVQLKELPVAITRLYSVGEQAPAFNVRKPDGGKVALKDFEGKFLLVNFWSAQSRPSVSDIKSLQPIYKSLKTVSGNVEFLSICLDKDFTAAAKVVADAKISWTQGVVDGWGAPTVEVFGVRSIPSYWLIDKSGKIVVNNDIFFRLFQQGINIQKVIADGIAGKDMMKIVEAAEKQKTSGK